MKSIAIATPNTRHGTDNLDSRRTKLFQCSDHFFDNCVLAELLLSCSSNGLAVESLGSGDGVDVERQRKLVCVVLDALPTGRQPIDYEAGHAVANE